MAEPDLPLDAVRAHQRAVVSDMLTRTSHPAVARRLQLALGSESPPGEAPPAQGLAAYIDHTLLRPEATAAQIDRLCDEALEHAFASVCVNPTWVARCARRLAGSTVAVCTVAGFPLGANTSVVKATEARTAVEHGATEIDMVINVGALRSGMPDVVLEEVSLVRGAAHEGGAITKVILETVLLTDDEKVIAGALAAEAGAEFVKTSTGFAGSGATVPDVVLLRAAVGPRLGVKASGGVRTAADARAMIEAGATRIGASAGVSIIGG